MNSKAEIKSYNQITLLAGVFGILITSVGIITDFYYLALAPLAIGAVFFCYYYPIHYVLVIAFLTPLSIFFDNVGGGLGLSLPTEPLIWIVFILYSYKTLISGQLSTRFISIPLVGFILVNLIWMGITVATSSMPFVSLKYYLARIWFVLIFFFFLFRVFKDPVIIRKFLSWMLIGTFLVVAITLIKHSREGFTRDWGYDIMKPFFEDHTIYSAYISFFVPIAVLFAFRGNLFGFKTYHNLLFLGITIVLLIGIVYSFTRASWISLIAAYVFYLLIEVKVKFKHIVLALGLVLAVGLIKQDAILYSLEKNKQGSADDLESHAQSVSNITTDPSNLERLNRWHCAILMFKERPVFGFGPGTYTFQYAPFQRPEDLTLISTHSGDLGNTHSEYFNALSETGLIGFITWTGMFLASIALGLQLTYNHPKAWVRSTATAVLLGLTTYYVHAFLNNFSDFDKIAVPLWGFMAILTAMKYYKFEEDAEQSSIED